MNKCNIDCIGTCTNPCKEGDRCIRWQPSRITTIPPRIIADLVGKPYQDRGRGPDVFDCEGLFLEVQRRLGYEGAAAALSTPEQRARGWLHIAGVGWRELNSPCPGCAVFIPQELHVGTMYDTQRFFHTSSAHGSAHIDLLDAPEWKHKTKLFYDWRPA